MNLFVENMLRVTRNLVLPFGCKDKVVILAFHRVLKETDSMISGVINEVDFDKQMEVLHKLFNVIKLSDLINKKNKGTIPDYAVCITFDDGYADNYEIALPILKKWDLPATFFISTGFLDGGIMWNDSILESVRTTNHETLDLRHIGLGIHQLTDATRYSVARKIILESKHLPMAMRNSVVSELRNISGTKLRSDYMMSTEQVRYLAREGMDIGAHTVNHPILSKLSVDEAMQEIIDSKNQLTELTNTNIELFAYPNGKPGEDYTAEHADIVKEAGFSAAVSTEWGYVNSDSRFYELPRMGFSDSNQFKFFYHMVRGYFN